MLETPVKHRGGLVDDATVTVPARAIDTVEVSREVVGLPEGALIVACAFSVSEVAKVVPSERVSVIRPRDGVFGIGEAELCCRMRKCACLRSDQTMAGT